MPRGLRNSAPGLFHVTAHSVWSGDLFRDGLDRVSFSTELASIVGRYRWTCIAACLMTSHYHLLLDVSDESLPRGMQQLNFRYAIGFNRRHLLRGHAFGGRYASVRVESEQHLLAAFRYIARNPVAAGACDRPELWPWSSRPSLIGLQDTFTYVDASRVVGCFGDDPSRALDRLRVFVESP